MGRMSSINGKDRMGISAVDLFGHPSEWKETGAFHSYGEKNQSMQSFKPGYSKEKGHGTFHPTNNWSAQFPQ